MIKNVPNKYSINILKEELNYYYDGKYDFLYLPLDPSNNCNMGYAFINLVDPLQILMFCEIFKGKRWQKFNSMKQCEITYARFQGKKELNNHYEKTSNFTGLNDDKKPFIMNYDNTNNVINVPCKYMERFRELYPFVDLVKVGKYSFSFVSFQK